MFLKQKAFFILFLLFMLTVSGCRIVVPSPVENQALLNKGVFPEGTPAWVSQGATLASRRTGGLSSFSGGGVDLGFVPSSFGPKEQQGQFDTLQRRKAKVAESEKAAEDLSGVSTDSTLLANDETLQKPLSPLQRLAKRCPQVEDVTAKTLTVENRAERIKRFESIVKICSDSEDLYFWLAADYFASRDWQNAEANLYKALNLNPKFAEAEELIVKVRAERNKEVNESFAPKSSNNKRNSSLKNK